MKYNTQPTPNQLDVLNCFVVSDQVLTTAAIRVELCKERSRLTWDQVYQYANACASHGWIEELNLKDDKPTEQIAWRLTVYGRNARSISESVKRRLDTEFARVYR